MILLLLPGDPIIFERHRSPEICHGVSLAHLLLIYYSMWTLNFKLMKIEETIALAPVHSRSHACVSRDGKYEPNLSTRPKPVHKRVMDLALSIQNLTLSELK